eukprot:scaffold2661_cov166-Amphora_coffeaeformis.AAC.4
MVEETSSSDMKEENDETPRLLERQGLGFRNYVLLISVGLIGLVSAAFVLAFGLTSAYHDQRVSFERTADELISRFEKAFDEYSVAGLWIHEACRKGDKSREDFRTLYHYLESTGLVFQAVSFAMNVSHDERPLIESSTREFLNSSAYTSVDYHGISGFELDPDTGNLVVVPRSEQPYYQAIHYIEPLENTKNQAALDFDLRTSALRWTAVTQALATQKPAVTERLKLIQETQDGTEAYAYSVIIMHPGMPGIGSQDVAVIALRIPELLARAHTNFAHDKNLRLYVFDSAESTRAPAFLGGAWLQSTKAGETCDLGECIEHRHAFLDEVELDDVHGRATRYLVTRNLKIASRQWTFVVLGENDAYDPDLFFVVFGSCLIVALTISLLVWIRSSSYREARLNGFRAQAEAEKAALLVQSAENTAVAQRELNDFIAHEVRNPLSAAISACCFVNSQVKGEEPPGDTKIWNEVKEDVGIIGSSLQFINDLLRDMLDMNRASSNQLKIDKSHVDILKDVLEPVAAMLYARGGNFEVQVECPRNLVVESDRLRLKQIVMNLGRNAAKFVTQGFIRLKANVENGHVRILVEDSGPGIPDEKKETLFAKYQDSLDSLNQGTGIGLSLSSKLVGLLGGEIWLSSDYQSGLDHCPGASFVIDLKVEPIPESLLGSPTGKEDEGCVSSLKIFANISTFYRLTHHVIAVDKQLLGTETVRLMRSQGVDAIVCGLSANDLEKPFIEAGADGFWMKPFPADEIVLEHDLHGLLIARGHDLSSD